MDPAEFSHLPRCVECKKTFPELQGVMVFQCHFCVICLRCVHYFLAIRNSRKCGVCGAEVPLKSLQVDDKMTTLAVLLRFPESSGLSGDAQKQWVAHYSAELEKYAQMLFPKETFKFVKPDPGFIPDFSERQEVDVDKLPDMTETGWLCDSCGHKNPFLEWRCEQCRCIHLAWHSVVTGEHVPLPSELVEILKFREVKTTQNR